LQGIYENVTRDRQTTRGVMDDEENGTGQVVPTVRPVTQNVYECLLLDVWPTPSGVIDFGIESEDHYGALQHAVCVDDVTPEELDRALGNGAALTALIRPDNPYHGVEFKTVWDVLRG
jgi:hypothetical protein